MTVTRSKTDRKAWAGAIAHPAQEFSMTKLPVLSGQVPSALRGTLYRNGPARLERGGTLMGHWFDGDGAILAVHFTETEVNATYRYVQTAGYLAESEAGELRYGNYGMTAPGAFWNRWFRPVKNVANTSVLALPDKLLALWEGGKPHALDLQTLKTFGLDDLGALSETMPYSAHPKRDPETGEIFNFGVSPGKEATLNVYKSDRTGKIIQTQKISLDGIPLIHDFVLAGNYLIFCIPPVRMNALPVLVGLTSFSDSLEWKPELGTQLLILDRHTLEVVSRGEADPWYQWHFGNGYLDKGAIVLDLVRYPDFQTNQYLKEVRTGQTQTSASGTLWQIQIDPQSGQVKSQREVIDRGCEFPIVPPQDTGRSTDSLYFSIHRSGADPRQEIFGAIARYDHKTDRLTEADCGENRYPSEPIFAPNADNPDRGSILSVVYDGNSNMSEVWIWDSDRLNEEPTCRLGLPQVIPHSFHGTWKGL